MRRFRSTLLAAGLLLGTGARDASAQTPADSLALARVVADMIVAGFTDETALRVLPPETRFDSLVARALQSSARFQGAAADSTHTMAVGTRDVVIGAETAEVTLQTTQCQRDDQYPNWWSHRDRYPFSLSEGAWRQTGPGRPVLYSHGMCGEAARREVVVTKDGP